MGRIGKLLLRLITQWWIIYTPFTQEMSVGHSMLSSRSLDEDCCRVTDRESKSRYFSGCSPALEANKDVAGSPSGTDQT